jgi:hypothetical protein
MPHPAPHRQNCHQRFALGASSNGHSPLAKRWVQLRRFVFSMLMTSHRPASTLFC